MILFFPHMVRVLYDYLEKIVLIDFLTNRLSHNDVCSTYKKYVENSNILPFGKVRLGIKLYKASAD